jgi:Protein of unknown function (DUF2730)
MEGDVLNLSPVVVWVIALSQLLNFGLAVYNLLASGSRATAKLVADLSHRIDGHEVRLTGLEQSQGTLPRASDLHELELAMAELKGEMKTMSAVIRGQSDIMQRVESIVGRHEQHLLDGGKR